MGIVAIFVKRPKISYLYCFNSIILHMKFKLKKPSDFWETYVAVQYEWYWMKGQLDLWCCLIRFDIFLQENDFHLNSYRNMNIFSILTMPHTTFIGSRWYFKGVLPYMGIAAILVILPLLLLIYSSQLMESPFEFNWLKGVLNCFNILMGFQYVSHWLKDQRSTMTGISSIQKINFSIFSECKCIRKQIWLWC